MSTAPVKALEIRDLFVSIRTRAGGRARVLDGVSLSVPRGGTVGLVGESGSGKTMTSLAVGTSYVLTFDLGYGGNSVLFGGPVTVRVNAGSASSTFTSGSGTPNPAVWLCSSATPPGA